MGENINRRIISKVMGRRPNVLANGTHNRLEAPNERMFTAMRRVSSEKGVGGNPNTGVDAYTGSALEIEEVVKLTTNGSSDMQARRHTFRHHAKFKGSAGSVDGSGSRRSSSWCR